jgi:membrane protease YdiL (CAAX protease family)
MDAPDSAPSFFDRHHPSQLVLLGIALVFLQQVLQVAVGSLVANAWIQIILTVALVFIAIPLHLIGRADEHPLQAVRLHPLPLEQIFWLLVLAASIVMPINALGEMNVRWLPIPDEVERALETLTPEDAGGWILAVLGLGLLAPVGEELVFRGIVQQACRRMLSPIMAAILSGLLFAVLHFQPWFLAGLGLMGIVLGLVYELSGSLTATILVHSAYNLSVLLVQAHADKLERVAWLQGASGMLLLLASLLLTGWAFLRLRTIRPW